MCRFYFLFILIMIIPKPLVNQDNFVKLLLTVIHLPFLICENTLQQTYFGAEGVIILEHTFLVSSFFLWFENQLQHHRCLFFFLSFFFQWLSFLINKLTLSKIFTLKLDIVRDIIAESLLGEEQLEALIYSSIYLKVLFFLFLVIYIDSSMLFLYHHLSPSQIILYSG